MRICIYVILVLALFSCKEAEESIPIIIDTDSRQIVILNEGNFRSVNATLSLYYPEKGNVEHEVFRSNNNSRPLGDVVQSITKIGTNGFIAVNNSSKIEVVDLSSYSSISTINGFNSPRYILPISVDKAYVSDLYEDYLYIINPQSFLIVGRIETKGWTEEMVLVNEKAFVCHMDSSQILVIDTKNDSIIERIPTNKSPSSIGLDQDGMVWVACTGGIQESFPAIHIINPSNFEVKHTMEWPETDKSIQHICVGPNGNKIYYIMGDLFLMDFKDTILPTLPIVGAQGRNFYGLGIDTFNGDIYIGDALDYQQRGVIYRFNEHGEEVTNFKAGLIPANFFFN